MPSSLQILRPVPARLVRASWALVSLLTVASVLGTATSPLLLVKAPLLLIALAPDGRHVALAAGRVDPLLLLGLSVLRRTLYGVGVYGLGAAYGELAVRWLEARAGKVGRALRVLEALFRRAGAALLIVMPFLTLCVLAGAARARLTAVLPALLLGHSLWAGAAIWFGTRFANAAQQLVDFFAARLIESTLLCAVVVVLHQVITRRTGARTPDARRDTQGVDLKPNRSRRP